MKKKNEELKINWLTTSILVILPIIVIVMAIFYSLQYGVGLFELTLFVVTYYGANISVGLGLHRLWSHASYKANKVVEALLMLVSAGTLQGPAIAWASDHKFHHAFADTDRDPHTPLKYKNKIKGFLWAHIGWMMFGEMTVKNIDRGTATILGKNKLLVFQLKYYWQLATIMNTIVPALIGFIFAGFTLQGALAGLIFMGLGRAFQQQITFCVNSLCHCVGTKKYANDSSGDVWWMFFLLLGENWHNFHHAFGNDYRNGHKWYHFDVHKWLIAIMEKCGLAHNLVRTSEQRIKAVMAEMNDIKEQNWSQTLVDIENFAHDMARLASNKLKTFEKSASGIASVFNVEWRKQLVKLEESANNIVSRANDMRTQANDLRDRFIKEFYTQALKLQKAAISAGLINSPQLSK